MNYYLKTGIISGGGNGVCDVNFREPGHLQVPHRLQVQEQGLEQQLLRFPDGHGENDDQIQEPEQPELPLLP